MLNDEGALDHYFSGDSLYGDDFDAAQLFEWYEAEREGYAGEVLSRDKPYKYGYHCLNKTYGFRYLQGRTGLRAMGLGSAYGEEFRPILPQLVSIDIVDPSDVFAGEAAIDGVPRHYHRPNESGLLDFADSSFDVVTIFGVLHHIANVSTVVAECRRVLAPGGVMLCREPIVSMGDWRHPRPGLTKNERGIPYSIFREIMTAGGMHILNEQQCDFSPLLALASRLGLDVFNNKALLKLDQFFSTLFSFNLSYHRTSFLSKFAPASVYFAVQKPV